MNMLNIIGKVDAKKVMGVTTALISGVSAVMTALDNQKKDALLADLAKRVTELEKK